MVFFCFIWRVFSNCFPEIFWHFFTLVAERRTGEGGNDSLAALPPAYAYANAWCKKIGKVSGRGVILLRRNDIIFYLMEEQNDAWPPSISSHRGAEPISNLVLLICIRPNLSIPTGLEKYVVDTSCIQLLLYIQARGGRSLL